MKPEPLANKIKEWWNQARVLLNPKIEEEFRDEVNNLILVIKNWEKQRIQWLLKEIEKDIKMIKKKLTNGSCVGSCIDYYNGVVNALEITKEKIKKAFSGMIEE